MEALERIEAKIDRLDTRLDGLDITTTRQQAILEDHQRRSVANEQAVALLRKEVQPIRSLKDVAKLLAWVAGTATVLVEAWHLFGK